MVALMPSLTTTCADCDNTYELDIMALKQGHASWRLCPACREETVTAFAR